MGDRHLSGERGAAKNASEAVWWYSMAAYQGLPAGQFALGRCMEKGEGIVKNAAEAVTWYRLAVDASYAPAIDALGA